MIFSHFLSLAEEYSDYVRQDAIIYATLAYAGTVFCVHHAGVAQKSLACIRGFQFGNCYELGNLPRGKSILISMGF